MCPGPEAGEVVWFQLGSLWDGDTLSSEVPLAKLINNSHEIKQNPGNAKESLIFFLFFCALSGLLGHRVPHVESLQPALQTGAPSGKWLHLTLQLRGDVYKHCTTAQFKMVMAGHVQRRCARSNTVWSMTSKKPTPSLPTDKNPIKQFHQRTLREHVLYSIAPSSPFFGQRLKLSSAPELHLVSFHWLKGHLAQGPC